MDDVNGTTLLLPTEKDCKEALRTFSRQCAIDALYLWSPRTEVVQFLSGDESMRALARDAAREVSENPACMIARGAAFAACFAAPKYGVGVAASAVARTVARAIAHDAAHRDATEKAEKAAADIKDADAALLAYEQVYNAAYALTELVTYEAVRKKQSARLAQLLENA